MTKLFKSAFFIPRDLGVSRNSLGYHFYVQQRPDKDTTLRSHLVRPKDTVDPAKQDGVVYKIPCECGKVYVGETGRSMHERIKEHDRDIRLA